MGGPLAFIGTGLSAANAGAQLFNTVGGGKGGTPTIPTGGAQFPHFDAGPGGVSPEQAALSQYTLGQNLLRDRSTFANTGTGASTMSTVAAGGSRLGEAEQLAQMSNRNQSAAAAIAGQDFTFQQGLDALAKKQAQQEGFAAGASTGSFGTSTGSFGTGSSGSGGGGGGGTNVASTGGGGSDQGVNESDLISPS